MNESIDLTEILKDCPQGTHFYSSLHGDLLFSCMYVSSSASKITFIKHDSVSMVDGSTPITVDYYRDGRYYPNQGECTIFPSKDQRDWSTFSAPWRKQEESTTSISKEQRDWRKFIARWRKEDEEKYGKWEKMEKFDQRSFKPFDMVLVREEVGHRWDATFYSYKLCGRGHKCVDSAYYYCIPYNDVTKHLVGTCGEPLEFYRYWDDRIWQRK